MKHHFIAALALLSLFACGDEEKNKGGGKANAAVTAYCEANCARLEECGVENTIADDEDQCVTLCTGLTTAFGDCNPSKAVRDACVAALEKQSCEALENDDEEPEECAEFCQ